MKRYLPHATRHKAVHNLSESEGSEEPHRSKLPNIHLALKWAWACLFILSELVLHHAHVTHLDTYPHPSYLWICPTVPLSHVKLCATNSWTVPLCYHRDVLEGCRWEFGRLMERNFCLKRYSSWYIVITSSLHTSCSTCGKRRFVDWTNMPDAEQMCWILLMIYLRPFKTPELHALPTSGKPAPRKNNFGDFRIKSICRRIIAVKTKTPIASSTHWTTVMN